MDPLENENTKEAEAAAPDTDNASQTEAKTEDANAEKPADVKYNPNQAPANRRTIQMEKGAVLEPAADPTPKPPSKPKQPE